MPLFRIERYEIHTQAYLVEGDSEAHAIVRALNGQGSVAPDEFSEMQEFCETMGLPIMDNLPLTQQVYKLLQADTDLPGCNLSGARDWPRLSGGGRRG